MQVAKVIQKSGGTGTRPILLRTKYTMNYFSRAEFSRHVLRGSSNYKSLNTPGMWQWSGKMRCRSCCSLRGVYGNKGVFFTQVRINYESYKPCQYSFDSINWKTASALVSCLRHDYSTDQKKTYTSHKHIQRKDYIQGMLLEKKEKLKESGQELLKDIRETKNKVKEKMEEVIETENVWTLPNLLCMLRITLSPYLGCLIIQSNYNLALGLLVVAGVSDLLDGWIARTFPSQASKMGSFLDPMADKVLIASLFLTLTYMDFIPVILTCTIIARDAFLVGAGFYIRYQSLPPPRTLSRYFDVTHATAQLAPTAISKANTAVQLVLVASTLAAPVFGYVDHAALHALWYVTAGTTVASALSYVFSTNTYKFLKRRK